jgi:hypothetical protein
MLKEANVCFGPYREVGRLLLHDRCYLKGDKISILHHVCCAGRSGQRQLRGKSLVFAAGATLTRR